MELLPDYGPIYTETNLDRFPVEPLNTITNLLFLAVAIYWFRKKSSLNNQDFKNFLSVSLPLLLVGYVGGTIYHATRSHMGWMLMDVVPIYLIALTTSVYSWRLLNLSYFQIMGVFIAMVGIPLSLLWTLFPMSSSPHGATLGYFIMTLPVILPLLLDSIKMKWKFRKEFSKPLVLICLALIFRSLDSSPFVQENFIVGTHWLWHSFGAITCHYLLCFMMVRSEHQ